MGLWNLIPCRLGKYAKGVSAFLGLSGVHALSSLDYSHQNRNNFLWLEELLDHASVKADGAGLGRDVLSGNIEMRSFTSHSHIEFHLLFYGTAFVVASGISSYCQQMESSDVRD